MHQILFLKFDNVVSDGICWSFWYIKNSRPITNSKSSPSKCTHFPLLSRKLSMTKIANNTEGKCQSKFCIQQTLLHCIIVKWRSLESFDKNESEISWQLWTLRTRHIGLVVCTLCNSTHRLVAAGRCYLGGEALPSLRPIRPSRQVWLSYDHFWMIAWDNWNLLLD